MGLRELGFLTFHRRALEGSHTRCAFASLVRSVSTATNPLPYGFSGPSGIASTFTCAPQVPEPTQIGQEVSCSLDVRGVMDTSRCTLTP